MTMEGFKATYINNIDALPHHGLKIVIKRGKRYIVSDTRLIEYLSEVFAIHLVRGLKLYLNGIQVHKPDGFDSEQFELFRGHGGAIAYGNLKHVEKPPINNIQIRVKNVLVVKKNFERHKVEGWVNCNQLDLETSREGILEDNNIYEDFTKGLMQLLEKEFERKSESKDSQPRSSKKIAKLFVDAVKAINSLLPEITRPIVNGFYSNGPEAMGSISESGEMEGPCTLHKGRKDPLGKLITD